jgi:hypothetical protein
MGKGLWRAGALQVLHAYPFSRCHQWVRRRGVTKETNKSAFLSEFVLADQNALRHWFSLGFSLSSAAGAATKRLVRVRNSFESRYFPLSPATLEGSA